MLEQRIKIGEGGRLIIPAAYRKQLAVNVGDELVMRVENGELRLFHQSHALHRIQAAFKGKRPPKGSATDAFLNARKEDAGE